MSDYNIINVIKDLFTGNLNIADSSTSKARMAICNGCEAKNAIGMCTACGCVLSVKVKLQDSSCPMELW